MRGDGQVQVKSRVQIDHDRSSSRACWRSLCGEELPQPLRSLDCTKENVHGLTVSDSSRACGGVSAKSPASLQDNRFSNGILRDTPKRIFSAVFKDQLNGFSEILATLIGRAALTVGTRNLRTVSDEPVFVLLYDCREFIVHNR